MKQQGSIKCFEENTVTRVTGKKG